MQLAAHYDALWQSSLQKFRQNKFELDPLLEDQQDQRFGITLLARLLPEVDARVQQFLDALRQVEPAQYYYPASDRHQTLLSIISCYQGFSLRQISVPDYVAVVQESLREVGPFAVELRGITASPSCIMLQGYPTDDSLGLLRNQLRKNFSASGLEQTIDKRYAIITAHSTVVRFVRPLQQPDAFLDKLLLYKDVNFGTSTITEAELVYNDWYQRQKHVKVLHRFRLR
ncbi:mutarotase [Pontibacter qinzhouensis]|uniref:Mutarotase n=1 Tax=Pontibacter qinzhouensis TaxID=2603253 RepID=A0A5C8IYZ1_9BACT|nr:2'-5' RNA ligase family protein [Pontibacter qinzhouensis]TXK26409.1 mutarotase [Pontibacter qinzhouensis]